MFGSDVISAETQVSRSASTVGRSRPSQFVGRIGALALLLGVGGAIAGVPAVAGADTGTTRDPGAAGTGQQAPADAADATVAPAPRRHTGKRGTFADSSASDSPAPDAATDNPNDGPVRGSTVPGKRGAQRSTAVADERAAVVIADGSGTPAISVPAQTNAPVVTLPTFAARNLPTFAAARIAAASPAPAPAAAVTAPAPALASATAPGSVSGLNAALLAFLGGGGDTNSPASAPLAWATLAVTRRQSAVAASVAAPASSISDFLKVLNGGGDLVGQLMTSLTGQVSQLIKTNLKDIAPLADQLAPVVVSGLADFVFGGTVAPELNQLANDPQILAFVSNWAAGGIADRGLPAEINAAVGDAAASLVQNVFGGKANTAVRAAIDNYLSTLPVASVDGVQLITDLISGKVTVGQLVNDQVGAALTNLPSLLGDPAIKQALGGALTDAIGVLSGGAAPEWAVSLDPTAVATFIGDKITEWAAPQLGGDLAGVLGDAAAKLLPALGPALGSVAGTAVTTFLGEPGVVEALSAAGTQVINAVLGGTDSLTALTGVWSTLQNDASLTAALSATLTAALQSLDTSVLGNPDVVNALGDAVTAVVGEITGNPATWSLVTDQLTQLVAGTSFAPVISGLLSNPALTGGLADLAGQTVVAFLGQSGVSTAVTDIAGQFASAVLDGADPYAALQNALGALQADPAIHAAVDTAFAGLLKAIGDTAVTQQISDTVAIYVTQFASDPVVRAAITGQLGATLGNVALDLLTPLADNISQILTPAISGLLNDPVVGPALSAVVADVLGGADPMTALQGLLDSVQNDPTFQDAVGTALSNTVNTIFDNADIRNALGGVAGDAVSGLLVKAGINFAPLTSAVNTLTDTAVAALLGNPLVGNLVSGAAIDILGGLPISQLPATLVHTVLTSVGIQDALGAALGKGIGSVLGNNIVGNIVGQVAGLQAKIAIRLIAAFALFASPGAAASASSSKNQSPAAAAWWLPRQA